MKCANILNNINDVSGSCRSIASTGRQQEILISILHMHGILTQKKKENNSIYDNNNFFQLQRNMT